MARRRESEAQAPGTAPDETALARAWAALAQVTDPEIPVLSLEDLGVIRDVRIVDSGVQVDITPTYSGCPAMTVMALDIEAALAAAGFQDVRVKTVLSPAWTTDLMSDEGRRRLRAYGIAPPAKGALQRALFGDDEPTACPQCGALETAKISEFGSTPCKALWRCNSCGEPFDAFKCI